MSEFKHSVFLIDNDSALCSSLERVLRRDTCKVESFSTAEGFLARSNPDAFGCVVLEVCLPDMGGLLLQQHLSAAGILFPLVFLTRCNDLSTAVSAIKAGAVDFLQKPMPPVVLADLVRTVLDQHVSSGLARLQERYAGLTAREREVLTDVAAGRRNKEIADKLGVTERTVKCHRGAIMTRMQARSAAQLIHMAASLRTVQAAVAGPRVQTGLITRSKPDNS